MTTDFDFMEVNLNDAIDLKSVPDGTEAKIQIMDAEPNGEKCYVRCRMKITNQGEGIKSFSHFLSYPKPEDEAETKNNKLLRIRTFLQAFRIDEGQRSNLGYPQGRS
jgi:hypothetical protein